MDVAQTYAQHLSETDLRLLAPAAGLDPVADETPTRLRSDSTLIEPALVDDGTFDAIFGLDTVDPTELLVHASPFLVFAVAVHRGIIDLHSTSFVEERLGTRGRVPVFGTDDLATFTFDPARRLFLIQHLTSYTRVRSGPVFVKRGNRVRRQRFSEIDPSRLAALLNLVPEDERPGIYRRLGDLALFLTGVFPDSTTRKAPHPIEVERLLRTIEGTPELVRIQPDDIDRLVGNRGRAGLLEWLGPKWYRLASASSPLPPVADLLGEVAEGFDQARRFLTLVTDRYLFQQNRWFGPAT